MKRQIVTSFTETKKMANHDFTTTLLVNQTPKQVYDAVNHPENWWPGEIDGSSDKLNDEFTYRYKELHLSRQRVVEMIPDQNVLTAAQIPGHESSSKAWQA